MATLPDAAKQPGEGNLQAPVRHPLNWQAPEFYDHDTLFNELERVFDICHGCRRCVSLCHAFPTLFDLIDGSATMEVDGVDKSDYWRVVDQCYLCDLCYMTKCPYTPPHPWNVDFPHLMLRAKAVKFREGKTRPRDRLITSTNTIGRLASIPIICKVINKTNHSPTFRKQLEKVFGIAADAVLPEYHANTARKRLAHLPKDGRSEVIPAGRTRGRVALFATCYGNFNQPELAEDLVKVFNHNDIPIRLVEKERCCGMPKLELGDFEAVGRAKEANIPVLIQAIEEGWDIVAPIPSCVLMFKQEHPLLFPSDPDVARVREHIFDPFEYLLLRHKAGLLKTDFKDSLGKIAYHVSCHLRVQNMGLKTRDVLTLVPGTEIEVIERCSGHDGTYAVKSEFHEISMKICRPVVSRVQKSDCDHYSSDCPMAGEQIQNGLQDGRPPEHPLSLLCRAYGLK